MFRLAFCIFMVIIFSILADISLHRKEAGELIVDIIFIFFFIYVSLVNIKSVF